ncbi:MAG TPA: hypothetical protein DCY07_07780 [Rhodospirillaceae bacterium]|nr:hypothetical protein [Rhodospirillaceae bacterium]
MISSSSEKQHRRLAPTTGIAIGPILFIIAILGILAAVITAASSAFTAGTTNESSRTKAAALIDIGQHLKIGFERIVSNGIDFDSVIIDPTLTSLDTHLFAPAGGGITSPSPTMAATPATDVWLYPLIAFPGTGGAAGQRFAVIRVDEGVCDEVNLKANALAAGTAHAEVLPLGDFTSAALLDDSAPGDWPASLEGKTTGCVENSSLESPGFFFYQVIGIR